MAVSEHFESFEDVSADENSFLRDVLDGLTGFPKSLPCKYFYDEVGSVLFDRICDLPEYYPTRTEIALMEAHAVDMARAIGPAASLIEYGSGASKKVRVLLDALEAPSAYVAVDISKDFMVQSSQVLAADYPALAVHVLCADFTEPFDLPGDIAGSGRRPVGFFPGSTIGNFDRAGARDFLAGCVETLGPGGGLLVGVDLKKDPQILHDAYNDSEGVTAAFNLNLLERINRELSGDFDLARFEHIAFYDEAAGRIEMHLESLSDQAVRIGGRSVVFAKGERIHTENSHKYGIEEFQALAHDAGFTPARVWTDEDELFSVHFLEVD
jgi:dimethylhistidine N-methyltransferase